MITLFVLVFSLALIIAGLIAGNLGIVGIGLVLATLSLLVILGDGEGYGRD